MNLRPVRVRLEEARGVAREYEAFQAIELWEAYASRGLIPEDWVTCTGRVFKVGGEVQSYPHPMDAILFAADVPGVLRAEAIARQLTGACSVGWETRPQREVDALRLEWDPQLSDTDRAHRAHQYLAVMHPRILDGTVSGMYRELAATGYVYAFTDASQTFAWLVAPQD